MKCDKTSLNKLQALRCIWAFKKRFSEQVTFQSVPRSRMSNRLKRNILICGKMCGITCKQKEERDLEVSHQEDRKHSAQCDWRWFEFGSYSQESNSRSKSRHGEQVFINIESSYIITQTLIARANFYSGSSTNRSPHVNLKWSHPTLVAAVTAAFAARLRLLFPNLIMVS